MRRWRSRLVYALLLPTIVVAAAILGYYTLRSTRLQAELGEQTITQSLLLIAQQRAEGIERYVGIADRRVFGLIDVYEPDSIETVWVAQAEALTPGVRGVFLLDAAEEILSYAVRGEPRERRLLRRTFLRKVRPLLRLAETEPGEIKHLHRRIDDESHLFSYRTLIIEGQRQYLVASHDVGFLVREVMPRFLPENEAEPFYSVVDENGGRLYGPELAGMGPYVIPYRFPTTLSEWSLHVAPRQGALLQSRGQTLRISEAALPLISFSVVLLGVVFLIYAASKERALSDLKSEFIANVSHELKTPLSVIRMFGEMLREGRVGTEEKRKQYLEIICRETERLSSLIDNVLDFSALEQGKQRYEFKQSELVDLVRETAETFRYRSEFEGVDLTIKVEGKIPELELDKDAVSLAIVNLLDNAVKYGKQTPVELSVIRKPQAIEIQVRDHGPGIPDDKARQIFERFYRVSHHDEIRGSGIGLSLVKHTAEAHGGDAWARNAPDGGAEVGFSIPITSVAAVSRAAV